MDPETNRRRPQVVRQITATLALGLLLATALAPPTAASERESVAREGGTGIGAMVATLIYAPLKLVYATGGLVLSGLTWVWTGGDSYTAGRVARKAVGGDYVVKPSHIDRSRGEGFAFTGER